MPKGEKSVWIATRVHDKLRIDAAIAKMTIKDYLQMLIERGKK